MSAVLKLITTPRMACRSLTPEGISSYLAGLDCFCPRLDDSLGDDNVSISMLEVKFR